VRLLLRRILPGLLALLVLVLAALGWLAGTEAGLRLLWQQAVRLSEPALSAAAIEGRLAGSIRLADVRYETGQLVFAARSLRFDWSPAALLDGELRIGVLTAEGVRYEQRGAGSDEPVELPERISLPIAIVVQDLSVRDLVVVNSPQAEPLSIDAIALAGSYRGKRLEITRLDLRRPDLELAATAALQTEADYPLTGDISWKATLPDYAPLTAHTRLSGSLHTLQVEQTLAAPYALQASLTLGALLADLQLDGTLTLQDSELAAINATWPDMRLAGSLAARGPVDALQLDGTLDVQDPLAGALQLVFAGQLLPDALRFDTLRLTAAERPTRLDAQGSIGFGAQPAFDFQARWQALAWPLTGEPDYASREGSFTLSGTADAYRLDARGDLKVSDVLAGDLLLRARSGELPDSWQIEQARLSGGDSRIEASGQVGSVYDLAWSLHAPRLGDLVPQATGHLDGSGTLKGALAELAIQVRASGADIAVQGQRLGTLDIDGTVNLAADQTSRLQATVGDALLAGIRVARLDVNGSGTTAKHRIRLQVDSEQGNTGLDVSGHWDGTRWKFDLQQGSLAWAGLAPWQLAQAVSGELTRERLQLSEQCWTSAQARACGRFAGSAQDYSGAFTLTQLPLAYFASFFPERVSLEGELNAHGDFRKDAGKAATLNMQIDSTPLQLRLPQDNTDLPQSFSLAPATASITVLGNKANLLVDLPFAKGPGGVHARVALAAPADGDWLQGALQGELNLDWPDIAMASSWIPEVAELRGHIDGAMQLSGTPAAPRLQGRLALAEGAATLVTPGLTLEDVSVELAGQPSGDIRITASARSGGGTLQGDGFLNPVERRATVALRGSQFQVMDTAEAKIFASPDLQLVMDSEQTRITGRIDIPSAHLRPSQPPPSAVSVSPDQVIVVEGEQEGAAASYDVDARVRIVLGDDVDIDGLGLTGKLHGDVLVIDAPGQPANASGELSVSDGRYEAYGQKLTIRKGRLLFAGGAVTEPGLDIEAVRKPAADVLVGVRARGKLRTPKFTLFSEPSMSQSEQLSWLVLGRPMEGGTSASERSSLQTAALMLGMSGGESIGKSVGDQLGLDEVSVGSEPGADVNQASLLVGKYLTPDLFVSYGIGLFEPVSTLHLRYALSSRWKLVGATSALESSADLLYEIKQRK
jgi:autotransporter translocation and assembly factor TamB